MVAPYGQQQLTTSWILWFQGETQVEFGMSTGIDYTNRAASGSGLALPEPETCGPKASHKRQRKYVHLCPLNSFSFVVVFYLIFLSDCILGVGGIDCFKCVSLNGDNPACEDPFHNNYSTTILESPCMAGRKHRGGLFPATACVKLAGYHGPNSERLMIRGCALDSGSLTTDTELIRVSHCGSFYFGNKYVKGCVQSCADSDGCNTATTATNFFSTYLYTVFLCLIEILIK